MKNIEQLLDELTAYVKDADKMNASVSLANVGWHVEHSLLVIIKMVSVLTASDPTQYNWKFNLSR